MAKSDEFIEKLAIYATNYLRECMSHTKEVVSGSGKVVAVMDRHIPTIDYFLNIFLLCVTLLSGIDYYKYHHPN